jgi:hypothetical protein
MARALWRPGRSAAPLPDGGALPQGMSPEARAQRDDIAEALADPECPAHVSKPLHATRDEYDLIIAERMRTLTLAERIDIEIALTQRRRPMHTSDYDPLRY